MNMMGWGLGLVNPSEEKKKLPPRHDEDEISGG